MYRGEYDKQLNWPDRMRLKRIPRIHVRMRHVWRYGNNSTPGIMMTCKKAGTSCKSCNSITEFRLYSHSALKLRRGYMTQIWRICTVWQEVIWLYEHEISANITDSYIRMSLQMTLWWSVIKQTSMKVLRFNGRIRTMQVTELYEGSGWNYFGRSQIDSITWWRENRYVTYRRSLQ
jgi:hypothetical protein